MVDSRTNGTEFELALAVESCRPNRDACPALVKATVMKRPSAGQVMRRRIRMNNEQAHSTRDES